MRYLYRSFLRTMMHDAECKPISEESRRFHEIALQDERRSDFNRLLLRWWIALVCVLLNKIWLHRAPCFARLFVRLAIFLPFSTDVDKVSTITLPSYELWSDISRGKNDGFIKFANRKARILNITYPTTWFRIANADSISTGKAIYRMINNWNCIFLEIL